MGEKIRIGKEERTFQYAVISENGGRSLNEDAIGYASLEECVCFVLADGLGGHGGGELASRIVTEEVLRTFKSKDSISSDVLKACFENAQQRLLEEQKNQGTLKNRSGMKSTLVIWMSDGDKVVYGHIGDSRLYEFQNGKYVRRTIDHSVPQMLVLAGELKESDIRGHSDRNRLLRVMGIEWDKSPYVLSSEKAVKEGDAWLLCSDGFWEWIEEERMEACLKRSESAEQWLEDMVLEVQKNAVGTKMDNYSAIAITVNFNGKCL